MFSVAGTIQSHRGRGRTLGYPTLNLPLTQSVEYGVYAGYVYMGEKKYSAAVFVGPAITFEETDIQIEAHLLDWTGPITQPNIRVEAVQFIRPNEKFSSAEALQKQIANDIIAIRLCLQALSKVS